MTGLISPEAIERRDSGYLVFSLEQPVLGA